MKFRWEKKYLYWGITAFLVIILSISFFLLLNNSQSISKALGILFKILKPFFLGFAFAYLLNPVMDFVENKWITPLLKKSNKKKIIKLSRPISITITIIFALAILTGLFIMVLPQLAKSIIYIINNLEDYSSNFQQWILNLFKTNDGIKEMISQQISRLNSIITDWTQTDVLPQINDIISKITTGVLGILSALKNIFIGLIISIYILSSKEKFFAQSKKITYAIFPIKASNVIIKTVRRCDNVFGGFVTGTIIDSVLVGIVCFIGMSIIHLPFPLLISVIIGVTNVIPFFGPFIGGIPSALLILMISPLQCLYFCIFILALQQLDGNVIVPRILGNTTGLSPFWVMFALLVFGGLFGFIGMLIGVPTFAVIYSIIVELIDARLIKHELPSKTKDYMDIDHINEKEDIVPKNNDDDVIILK